jgi:SAM-dependent methyltransferase
LVLQQIKGAAKALLRARFLARSADGADLTFSCSVAALVARHNGAQGYARLDLFVAYLAIQESEGASTGGIALFTKLLAADQRGRVADRALLATLQRGPLSSAVFLPGRTSITQDMTLSISVAGLAIALYSGATTIPVSIAVTRASLRYDAEWFRTHGFTDDEVLQICVVQDEIYRRIGVLPLTWSTLQSIQEEMRQFLPRHVTLHGRGDFYQTLEPLLIPGQRPTALRFDAYDLRSVLRPMDRLLDIGCNCGFLALTAARYVRAVDGIDAAAHFISIGRIAQRILQQDNCEFRNCLLEDFTPAEPYDVVFSFAVHHWIGLSTAQYAARLRNLLKPGGSLLLESHDLSTHDADWDVKLATFCNDGFEVMRSGTLCDDGLLVRQHVLLRRSPTQT